MTDAAYQVWLMTMSPYQFRKFYYDFNTLDLIGHEGIVTSPPNDAVIQHYPVQARIGSPLIEPNGSGRLQLDWLLDYDALIDSNGNGGQESAFASLNLQTHIGQYKMVDSSIIPGPNALSFDEFLRGFGFALLVTIEPNPKPATLTSKANNMILAGQIAYFPLTEGTYFNLRTETIRSYPSCAEFVHPLWEGFSF